MKIESGKWYESSDHKLEADEIQERVILFETKSGFHFTTSSDVWRGYIINYENRSKEPVIRYILIDPPEEEPMEFGGAKPEIIPTTVGRFFCDYRGSPDKWHIESPIYNTRAEAIHAWNEFIRKVQK